MPYVHLNATRLQRAYRDYNKRYFRSQLDEGVRVKWANKMKFYGRTDGHTIEIASWQKKHHANWNLTLLHEMAHVATDSEKAEHGPRWKREMRRLARIGAFDNLW